MNRDDIVCACLDITYGDIEDAVKDGAKTFEELQEKTDVGSVCGVCIESVREMFETLA